MGKRIDTRGHVRAGKSATQLSSGVRSQEETHMHVLKMIGLIQVAIVVVATLLWWILGVHTTDRLSTIFMVTGSLVIGIGALTGQGSTYGPLHHDYRMGRTIGSSTPVENYEREIRDKEKSYSALTVLFVAGAIQLALGFAMMKIFK